MRQAEQKRMWRSFRCYLELEGSLLGRRRPLSAPGSPQVDPRKQHRVPNAELVLVALPTWLA